MDLTNYLPPDLLDLAYEATKDPSIISRLKLTVDERITLFSVANMLEGGAKLFKPSARICEALKDVELNLGADDYAQPYDGLGVILPVSLFGSTKDRIATSVWMPGRSVIITFFDERGRTNNGLMKTNILILNPPPGMSIEEYLTGGAAEENLEPKEVAELHEITPIARVVINLCLFAVERGVRSVPQEAQAMKRRRKAQADRRMARLAARDAQEIIIQDLDLILRASPNSKGEGDGSDGRRQGMHRRRGHWKMQTYGPDTLVAISWSRFDDLWLADDSSLPFPIEDSTIRWVNNGIEGINTAVGDSSESVMFGRGLLGLKVRPATRSTPYKSRVAGFRSCRIPQSFRSF